MAYKACIVGLGKIGARYDMTPGTPRGASHAGAIGLCPHLQLAGGADRDFDSRNQFEHFFGVPSFGNLEEMLSKIKPDLICISVPPEQQAPLCISAIRAGVRIIVCEKPFIMNADTARQVIRTCDENRTLLVVNHWMRWSKKWDSVRDFINDGHLGKIRLVRYIYAKGVYNSGTHAADIMRYLFGDVSAVEGYRGYSLDSGEVNIDGTLHFQNGLTAELRTVDYRDHFTTECDIIGSLGRIVIGDDLDYWQAKMEKQPAGDVRRLERQSFPLSVQDDQPPLVRLYNEVLDHLETGAPDIRCSGRDGLKAFVIAAAIDSSSRRQGETVFLTSEDEHV